MPQGFPPASPGMVIGLLGGSFDPAHEGHVHITREAMKRFGLDRVWWLVSPGNPLKPRPPAALPVRLAEARRIMRHPRVTVTDLETRLGTRFTAATLRRLRRLYPRVRFVWLMGADNLAQLDRWEDWRWIMENVALGVLARPGSRIQARGAKAAEAYRQKQVKPAASRRLASHPLPAWSLVDLPMRDISSSEIRARGAWGPRGWKR